MHFWTRAVKFFIYKIPFWLVYKGVAISFTNHQKLGQLIMDDRGEEPSYTYGVYGVWTYQFCWG